jgi:predicted DsbA family dithiol-disulfide isomerase
MDINEMKKGIKMRIEKEGLPSGNIDMLYNTRLSQELAKWADSMNTTEEIQMLLYKAYFVDNYNLCDIDVLLDIAEKAGLSKDEARDVLEKRTMQKQIDEDWQLSKDMKITGVPTFIVNDKAVVGFQSYDVIEALIKNA